MLLDEVPAPWLNGGWSTAFHGRWSGPEDIMRLEGRALVMSVRHALRSTQNLGHHLVFLCDNLALVLAVTKGRGSSPSLNATCRELSALSLLTGCSFHFRWVPSELNPSDGPSRGLPVAGEGLVDKWLQSCHGPLSALAVDIELQAIRKLIQLETTDTTVDIDAAGSSDDDVSNVLGVGHDGLTSRRLKRCAEPRPAAHRRELSSKTEQPQHLATHPRHDHPLAVERRLPPRPVQAVPGPQGVRRRGGLKTRRCASACLGGGAGAHTAGPAQHQGRGEASFAADEAISSVAGTHGYRRCDPPPGLDGHGSCDGDPVHVLPAAWKAPRAAPAMLGAADAARVKAGLPPGLGSPPAGTWTSSKAWRVRRIIPAGPPGSELPQPVPRRVPAPCPWNSSVALRPEPVLEAPHGDREAARSARCEYRQLRPEARGASDGRLTARRSLAVVKQRGRWRSDASLRRYVGSTIVLRQVALMPDDVAKFAQMVEANLGRFVLEEAKCPAPPNTARPSPSFVA